MASEVTESAGHERRTHEELGVRLFEPVPEGFDPLTASDGELLRHGYSARPDADLHPDLFLRWKRLVVQIRSVVAPVFGPVSAASAVASGQGTPKPFPTAGTSANWAGVVVFPDFFDRVDSVFGTWTVPNLDADPSQPRPFVCSAWIGIDGFAADTNPVPSSLVQVGTTRLLTTGVIEIDSTYPWFEWVPDGPSSITNLAVRPGDVMTCEIILTSSSEVSIHLTNRTSGVSTAFMKTAPGTTEAAGVCAEWIVELPTTVLGSPAHLGRYGSVYFSDCFASTRASVNLHPGTGELLTLVNGSNSPLSIPTKLGDTALKVDFTSGGGGA